MGVHDVVGDLGGCTGRSMPCAGGGSEMVQKGRASAGVRLREGRMVHTEIAMSMPPQP